MKLKLDAEGKVVVLDGKPVYVHDDGKEIAFDAPAAVSKISSLNLEAKTHREAKEAAEVSLKAFEGITDPAAAKKALETVKNFDDKKLVEAGEVERVKAEVIKAVEEKYAPVVKERDTLAASLNSEMIGGRFARSKLIAEKLAIPPDLVQSHFGAAFKIEEGKVVAYQNGNKILSRTKIGEVADFDEALETLIEGYPHRDTILKGSGANGGGAPGAGGGGQNGKKTMTRAQFDSASAADRMTHAKEGGVVVD